MPHQDCIGRSENKERVGLFVTQKWFDLFWVRGSFSEVVGVRLSAVPPDNRAQTPR